MGLTVAVGFGERCLNFSKTLAQGGIDALFSYIDGLVDGERYLARLDVVGGSWQHLERAVDGYRNHRQAEFLGQDKCSALEFAHLAGPASCSLGENYQRMPATKTAFGYLHGVLHCFCAAVVDHYVA